MPIGKGTAFGEFEGLFSDSLAPGFDGAAPIDFQHASIQFNAMWIRRLSRAVNAKPSTGIS
ncbi:hypothetical protein AB4Y33_43320, partial [Paraburkholderia sp. BR14319]|uniref:hypothetical protein n=1 Tax=Paraburkholderia sp. BR14319 TaxID=3237005 RepID=UPI0034D336BE